MARPKQSFLQIAASLRRPRAQRDIYGDYNTLRQEYILNQTARHFHVRDDDPAPLYGKTLLDVGCGESTIAEFLALSGAEITAIDKDAAALAKAEESAKAFGAPIHFMHTHVEKLINGLQKYDVILALDIMETAPQPAKLLWVLRQLLAPGGIIILSHINHTPKAWLLHIWLSGYVYARTRIGTRRWRRFHTPQRLAQLCRQAGLAMSQVQGLRFSLFEQRWELAAKPHTRYLAVAEAAQGGAIQLPKKASRRDRPPRATRKDRRNRQSPRR